MEQEKSLGDNKISQQEKIKLRNSRRGTTLIELLTVIAIIAILAATAMVSFAPIFRFFKKFAGTG